MPFEIGSAVWLKIKTEMKKNNIEFLFSSFIGSLDNMWINYVTLTLYLFVLPLV